MVWIKVADDKIINFENVSSIHWAYRIIPKLENAPHWQREQGVLEFYINHVDGNHFLIYNKKITEDFEKLKGDERRTIIVQDKKELFNPDLLLDDIVKNHIATGILKEMLSCLLNAKKKNSEEIINFYKVFGTEKES